MNKLLRFMNGVSGEGKRRRMRLPVEQQLEIIACFENGEKPARIARAKGLSDSSVRAIIRRKEELKKWLEINQTLGASKESSQFKTRSSAMETMERLLVAWIENCNQQNIRLDTPTIQAKAKDFFYKNQNVYCVSKLGSSNKWYAIIWLRFCLVARGSLSLCWRCFFLICLCKFSRVLKIQWQNLHSNLRFICLASICRVTSLLDEAVYPQALQKELFFPLTTKLCTSSTPKTNKNEFYS